MFIRPSRTRSLPLLLGLPPALASLLACAPAPQAPNHADATGGLSVCFNKEDSEDETVGGPALRRALGTRLEGAGYKLVEKGRCDVRLRWNFTTTTRGGDTSYTSVSFVIRGRTEDVLERIKVERNRGDAPIESPDLIAIPIVNAMNASPKLAAYASTRRRPAADRVDAGAPERMPDSGTPDAP